MLRFLLKTAALIAGAGLVLNAVKVHEEHQKEENLPDIPKKEEDEEKQE